MIRSERTAWLAVIAIELSLAAATRSVFAATSVLVGLREELTFRGVIQTLLSRRFGAAGAIGITTAIFTIWHVGAIPFEPFAFAQVVIASLLLGIIYARTGSLVFVAGLHAVYDALWSLTPLLEHGPILPYRYGIALLCLALIGIAWWGGTSIALAKTVSHK